MAYNNPYAPVISQVSLPFSSPIPGGLREGKQIKIQGVVQDRPGADGFSINLTMGPKIEPNTALHFNPRFGEKCIVRNTMSGGHWGGEERSGGMPIVRGKVFEIIIMTTAKCYHIAVNGVHFTEYKHRLPLKQVTYLVINGNFMKINFIKFDEGNNTVPAPVAAAPAYGFAPGLAGPPGGMAPPPYSAGGFAVKPAATGMGDALYNPSIPLTQLVAGGMVPNRMIFLSGVPHPSAKRFTINLQSGTASDCDVCLHFDVRLNWGNDGPLVVRTSRIKGKWGQEERPVPYFPFQPNAAFDMVILATPASYKVAVNSAHFVEYNHRLPLHMGSTLNINGDVRITSLRVQ